MAPFFFRLLASQARTLPSPPNADLHGRVFLVTGANSGIGTEIAHHLAARHCSKIILAVRNLDAGKLAREQILSRLSKNGKADVEIQVWLVDMANFGSIQAFAERCDGLERLDGVSMNAAALGGGEFKMTGDGHEQMTQVNILAPIFLTLLLAPVLHRTNKAPLTPTKTLPDPFLARVIFTGSSVAEAANTKAFNVTEPLRGLDDKARYTPADRYYESKLVLHALIRHVIPMIPGLVITDVNPGFVNTPFYDNAPAAVRFMAKKIGRTAEAGARNISMAMLTLDKSTDFYHDCKPTPIQAPWLESAKGIQFRENLWRESIKVFEDRVPGILAKARRADL